MTIVKTTTINGHEVQFYTTQVGGLGTMYSYTIDGEKSNDFAHFLHAIEEVAKERLSR